MKIPESAIRPFEPHGIPKTLMGEEAVKLLVSMIAKSIVAFQLNNLTKRELTAGTVNRIRNRIVNELTYGGLDNVSVRLILVNDKEELHCTIDYTVGGKQSATSRGWALFD